jgi:photosynthetic reaction center cytochrome c subunit
VARTGAGPIPRVTGNGTQGSDIYQNVQVLGDLSAGEFNRLMAAITAWVSPEEGCTYCHGNDGFAATTSTPRRSPA